MEMLRLTASNIPPGGQKAVPATKISEMKYVK